MVHLSHSLIGRGEQVGHIGHWEPHIDIQKRAFKNVQKHLEKLSQAVQDVLRGQSYAIPRKLTNVAPISIILALEDGTYRITVEKITDTLALGILRTTDGLVNIPHGIRSVFEGDTEFEAPI